MPYGPSLTIEADIITADMTTLTDAIATAQAALVALDRPAGLIIAGCNVATDPPWWIAFDSSGLASAKGHVTGSSSVEWDKPGGASMHRYSGVQKYFSGTPVDASDYGPDDFVAVTFRIPDTTYLSVCSLRIGVDELNYFRWDWDGSLVPDDEWVTLYARLGDLAYARQDDDGLDWSNIGHVFFNIDVTQANEAQTIDDMKLDRIAIVSAEAVHAATHGFAPTGSNDLAEVATTDAEWTSITLTAGATEAVFSLEGDSAYVVCKTEEPADADTGAIMFPNIAYGLKTWGRTKIWFRRTGTPNVTIHVTDSM